MALHKDLGLQYAHVPYFKTYPSSTERLADSSLLEEDEGKLARQLSDDTLWMLIDYSVPTWKALGSGVGPSGTVESVDLVAGSGISVSGGPITTSGSITVNNTDPGSAQYIFKTIAVSGQDDIVADSNNDTLTLTAGSNISITTNAASDRITITATGGGGGGGVGYPEHRLQQDIALESFQSYVVVGPLDLNGYTLTAYGRVKVT